MMLSFCGFANTASGGDPRHDLRTKFACCRENGDGLSITSLLKWLSDINVVTLKRNCSRNHTRTQPMARNSTTFNKREKEKRRLQKRQEKESKKEERKANGGEGKSFEDMLAYVDENGNLSSTPPDLSKKRVIREGDIDLTSRNKGGAGASFVRKGFVKFFNEEKGFGFIKDNLSGEEFFFHFQAADFKVTQSISVQFEIGHGPKGMVAVRITKAQ